MSVPQNNLASSRQRQTSSQQETFVSFKQINLQKSKVATSNLSKCLVDWSSSPLLVFLQEPWTSRGKICSLPRGTQIFAEPNARAAILATPEMKIWPMPEYSTGDMTCCQWITDHARFKTVVLISMYSDITQSAINSDFQKILQYCGANQLPVILCADTNAHSESWGCSVNNARGDAFEDIICAHNLSILNRGRKPTFVTSRAKSIIDVSLVHSDIFELFSNWSVNDTDFFSDHKLIEFQMNVQQPLQEPVRHLGRTDWNSFTSVLRMVGTKWLLPPTWTRASLEQEVDLFQADIIAALNSCTPLSLARGSGKTNGGLQL